MLNNLSSVVAAVRTALKPIEKALEHSYMEEMLDNLDSYAYIINADTYELGFVNKKVLMQTPEVKIGDICYQAIQHRDSPCEDCIFNRMNKQDPHERCTQEMFNYSLRSWCRSSASWLECKEENKLGLINAIDISEYFIG